MAVQALRYADRLVNDTSKMDDDTADFSVDASPDGVNADGSKADEADASDTVNADGSKTEEAESSDTNDEGATAADDSAPTFPSAGATDAVSGGDGDAVAAAENLHSLLRTKCLYDLSKLTFRPLGDAAASMPPPPPPPPPCAPAKIYKVPDVQVAHAIPSADSIYKRGRALLRSRSRMRAQKARSPSRERRRNTFCTETGRKKPVDVEPIHMPMGRGSASSGSRSRADVTQDAMR